MSFPRILALVAAFVVAAPQVRAEGPCRPPVLVEGHGVPAEVVDELAARAPALFEMVAERLDLSSCAPVRVDLLPAIEGANRLEPPWHLPGWAAGAAVPAERRVVVAVTANRQRQDQERVLLHELAHVGVREAAGDAAVPRWLDEGFARVLAGEHSTTDLDVLARARVADRLVPLAALADGFPGRSDLAALAYAESGRAVSLVEGTRAGAVADVLRRVRDGADIDDALAGATGRRTWQLDVDVERSIPLWRAWAVVGLETDLALAVGAVVCAWAGLRARRRLRSRILALDDDASRDGSPDGRDDGGLRLPVRRLPPPDVVLSRWTVQAS